MEASPNFSYILQALLVGVLALLSFFAKNAFTRIEENQEALQKKLNEITEKIALQHGDCSNEFAHQNHFDNFANVYRTDKNELDKKIFTITENLHKLELKVTEFVVANK